jgi:hypothetical protein
MPSASAKKPNLNKFMHEFKNVEDKGAADKAKLSY